MAQDQSLSNLLSRYGAAKIAVLLGLHRTTPTKWTRVPAEHAAAVSAATGIPRHVLRPDLWEPPESAAAVSPSLPPPQEAA